MSQLLARIMLAIFMLPCAAMVYTITFVVLEDNRFRLFSEYRVSKVFMWLMAGVVSWAFVAVYWTLLWRKSVIWDSRRVVGSLIAAALSAFIGVVVGVVLWAVNDDFGLFAGTVLAILAWLIFNTLLCCETLEERAARASGTTAITCPTCGYNLTGLQGTRCPECGNQFTLDELFQTQKSVSEAEVS